MRRSALDYVLELRNESALLDGWELYVQHGMWKIFRRPALSLNPALYLYRAIGGWNNIKPEILAEVYLDLDYRETWDNYMLSHQVITNDSSETDAMVCHHYELRYPWPLSNRDYVYQVQRKTVQHQGKRYEVIMAESVTAAMNYPERKGVIRIDTYFQSMCLTADSSGEGCSVLMDYYDDPKGRIPSTVVNWAARTGVPSFIDTLEQACLKYQQRHPCPISDEKND
ncbi:hypothetical protein EC973_006759 [Apophysomyces ossiformis]|uniref:Phosphatidylcholine transfer protein n=1 Tax=Apophysomyces ossiformis TaxID=679940 RepID=A0A8H7BVU9_9FUNG|nr:hypothetical protein EC973_006759 [Apophysomyces ossiformis]